MDAEDRAMCARLPRPKLSTHEVSVLLRSAAAMQYVALSGPFPVNNRPGAKNPSTARWRAERGRTAVDFYLPVSGAGLWARIVEGDFPGCPTEGATISGGLRRADGTPCGRRIRFDAWRLFRPGIAYVMQQIRAHGD
jgi:hypothetical protein